jgi:predicted nucleic acid-binding protein
MNDVVLFDTGILLRASTTTLDHADLCLSLWTRVRSGQIRACIAEQTIYEFYSVLTRLRVPHRKVVEEIGKHLAVFPVVNPKERTFSNVLESIARLRWLTGPQIYDLLLAHTAVDNDITALYTLNDRHFRKFNLPLSIVNPVRSGA